MTRLLLFLCAVCSATIARAQVEEGNPAILKEVRELRQIVEQQSKQIDALSQQLSKLVQGLDGRHAVSASPPAGGTAPSAEIPRAEAVRPAKTDPLPAGHTRHIVVKGETLTSIARQYNITIPELQKLNKIENDRKLQIGQTLVVPPAKTPEPATEKKENP